MIDRLRDEHLGLLPCALRAEEADKRHFSLAVILSQPLSNALFIAFVLGFGSSSALSGAYGASVMGTMLITTVLGAVAAGLIPAYRGARMDPVDSLRAE